MKRSRMSLGHIIQSKITPDVTGPSCLTCGRTVQKEEMVEQTKTGCKVLVTCHGQEELREFDFDTRDWDHTHLKRAMQRCRWFDPTKPKEDAWGPLTDEQRTKNIGDYDV